MRHALRVLSSRNSPLWATCFPLRDPHPPSHSHTFSCSHLTHPKTHTNPIMPIDCNFSSEPIREPGNEDKHLAIVSQIFSGFTDEYDISNELKLKGIVISNDMVLNMLNSVASRVDVAQRFFNWVFKKDGEKLCSKAHNFMLQSLVVNGCLKEFWDLVSLMKKKGYGVSRVTRDKALEKFGKHELNDHLERLRRVFASGSMDSSMERIGLRTSRLIRNQLWDEAVETKIKEMGVQYCSELVRIVLENLAMEPMKALMFFRWVEDAEVCTNDEKSYNAMARVLGREDSIDTFWKIVEEMKSKDYAMEMETYNVILVWFIKRKMIRDCVEIFEFAMSGANKPSERCFIFLLKKTVVAKEFDMALFLRVTKAFVENGNKLKDRYLISILKSLTSAGRLQHCSNIVEIMQGYGLVVSPSLQNTIATYMISSCWKMDEDGELIIDHEELKGKNRGRAFDILVSGHCQKKKAIQVFNLLSYHVNENQLKPWYGTYKKLIANLLVQGGFEEAITLLKLMKKHGFPPFKDPFIKHMSSTGTSDDALAFLNGLTSRKFPSISVVLRVFEAFFKARKKCDAHDLLSKCPSFVRNHADVLNLFSSGLHRK